MGSGSKGWPPIAAGLVAAVLVMFVLPNPLRIPQQNPAAQAEYAPVPSDEDSNEQNNFGSTGLGSSSGIGSGNDGGGSTPTIPPPPLPPQYVPRQKPCVGNPPRQTEDPLSPPCVAFFYGDNGGKTWKGVTKDEILIVMYNDWGIEGDMTQPWKPSDEGQGHQSDFNRTYIVRTVKAHLRYFQKRFQTYGRRVKVIAYPSGGGSPCPARRGDALAIYSQYDLFASIHQGNSGGNCFIEGLAEVKIPSFGINWDVARSSYYVKRGYSWGFYPDQETESTWSASFICDALRGKPARFTTDALLKGDRRSFGLVRPEGDADVIGELATKLQRALRDRCGFEFDQTATFRGDGSAVAATVMGRMRDKGVTTIVCYCNAYPGQSLTTMQNAATSGGYFPEWYLDHGGRGFRAIWNQLSTSKAQHPAFGVTHFWRGGPFREQYHYRAYLEEEPNTAPNVRFNFDIYHMFLNLFEGIQAAGPELTPKTVEQGMFTFTYTDRRNPFVPVGGYGPYDSNAVADYTFVDTGMAWWWDPNGTPPGGQQGEGCIRVMNQGRRYYWDEWPENDSALFASNSPCTQDNTEIEDPQPGDV